MQSGIEIMNISSFFFNVADTLWDTV